MFPKIYNALFCLMVIVGIFLFPSPLYAAAPLPAISGVQSVIPIDPSVPLPSPSCGIAGSATGSACCGSQADIEKNITDIKEQFLSQVVEGNPVSGVVGFLFNFLPGGPAAGSAIGDALKGTIEEKIGGVFDIVAHNTITQDFTRKCWVGEPHITQSQSTGVSIGNVPNTGTGDTCTCEMPVVDDTSILKLCNTFIGSGKDFDSCKKCVDNNGLYTGIGCVPMNLSEFITKSLLGLGVGLAGIFALGCIIFAAFQLQISAGNPEKIKKTQEMLTSCIMGLMLIIFAVFILRIIGVDILRIPGFGK